MVEQLPPEIMKKAVKGISYIAHPLRLRILEFIDVNGPSSVSAIAKAVGEEQMIVSQSLKKFREAHLVKTQRKGIFVYYDIYEEYPASIFECIRKLFAYMTDSFYYLTDKLILPKDYTTMVANRIKLFANYDKMRILEYLILFGDLKDDGFVSSRREGRFIYYNITQGVHKTALLCIRKRYDSLTDKDEF